MNWQQDLAGEDRELGQALKDFKASMDAWSEAAWGDRALSQSRIVVKTKRPAAVGWAPAASWALGCLLVVGSLAGAAHQMVHRQEMAALAAQKAAQKAAAERAAAEREAAMLASAQGAKSVPAAARENVNSKDEDLLASVDSDVSRAVPAAMEPLAQLMDEDGTQ